MQTLYCHLLCINFGNQKLANMQITILGCYVTLDCHLLFIILGNPKVEPSSSEDEIQSYQHKFGSNSKNS
jgi:hypothetical protein